MSSIEELSIIISRLSKSVDMKNDIELALKTIQKLKNKEKEKKSIKYNLFP